jgi:hypothetical protein
MALKQGRDRILELVARLDHATQQGSVEWKTSDRRAAFEYSTSNASVVVATVDDDGTSPYIVEVYDDKGIVVDSLRTSQRVEGGKQVAQPWNVPVAELYDSARRSALNTNKVIDDLMRGLPETPAPF